MTGDFIMKKICLILILSIFTSCENEAEKSEDEKTAEVIWQDIDGYSNWDQLSDWTGIKASLDGTHGNFVQIWINGEGYPSFEDSTTNDMPYGSVLVKEGYSDNNGTDVNNVTVMKKIEGFDPNHGDWFWASYDVNGSVNNAGSISSCYNCHASGTDYIRFSTH